MKKKLFLIVLVSFFFCETRLSCAAEYVGVKNFNYNVSNASVTVDSTPVFTMLRLSFSGAYVVTGCQGNVERKGAYGYRSIWIGDPVTDDGKRLTINIPLGTQMKFNNRYFSVQRTKRVFKNGSAGTLAVLGPYLPNMNRCDDIGRTYVTNISFSADIAGAISAGKQNLTFSIGYNEPFYMDKNAYGDIENSDSLISSMQVNSSSFTADIPGYCAASTFSSTDLEINHGTIDISKINGNEKNVSITYLCNTRTLPKISFLNSSNPFVDVRLCDGVKSRLTASTTPEGNYAFRTTFTSTLSRDNNSTCSGAFSGSTVVSINYD